MNVTGFPANMATSDFLTTLFIVIVGLIPYGFELVKKEETTAVGLISLIAIFGVILFYFIYFFIWKKLERYENKTKMLEIRMKEIETKLDYKENFYKLEKRISLVEEKHGKKRTN